MRRAGSEFGRSSIQQDSFYPGAIVALLLARRRKAESACSRLLGFGVARIPRNAEAGGVDAARAETALCFVPGARIEIEREGAPHPRARQGDDVRRGAPLFRLLAQCLSQLLAGERVVLQHAADVDLERFVVRIPFRPGLGPRACACLAALAPESEVQAGLLRIRATQHAAFDQIAEPLAALSVRGTNAGIGKPGALLRGPWNQEPEQEARERDDEEARRTHDTRRQGTLQAFEEAGAPLVAAVSK